MFEKNLYSNPLKFSPQRIQSARVRVEENRRREPVGKKMGSLACRSTAHAVAYLRVEAWSVAGQPQFVQVFKRAFRAFPPRSGRLAPCLSPPSDLEPRESAKHERATGDRDKTACHNENARPIIASATANLTIRLYPPFHPGMSLVSLRSRAPLQVQVLRMNSYKMRIFTRI